MRYPEDFINKVINGDCLESMRNIPNETIDLIISDYPFNIQDGRKDYIKFIEETSKEFMRISKPIANLVVINNPSLMFKTSKFFQDWDLINGIALIRNGSLRPAYHFGFQHNYCLILNRGGIKNKWNGTKINHDKDFFTDVINYQNGYRGFGCFHPQAINKELSDLLVKTLSNENDIVFDPFMGSGNTAISCIKQNKNFIGCELNKKFFRLCENRIERETNVFQF